MANENSGRCLDCAYILSCEKEERSLRGTCEMYERCRLPVLTVMKLCHMGEWNVLHGYKSEIRERLMKAGYSDVRIFTVIRHHEDGRITKSRKFYGIKEMKK